MNKETVVDNRGLFQKYKVERLDKSENHPDCQYFVLDMTHDKHAVWALAAYAGACRDTHPNLAKDLEEWVGREIAARGYRTKTD